MLLRPAADLFERRQQGAACLGEVVCNRDRWALGDGSDDDSQAARRTVADALDTLKGHLLTHLDYEEQNVASTTRRLADFRSPGR
jgi:hypothetical protein